MIEPLFRCPGQQIRPFSHSVGISARCCSLPLQRVMTDFGADHAFGKVPKKLQEHYGIEMPVSTIRTVTENHGQQMNFQRESSTLPVYHDDDYNSLIKGLRTKVSKIRTKLFKFNPSILIDWKLCKQLGFCDTGIEEFCSQFNFNPKNSYDIHEIITRVQQNKKRAAPFIAELNMLSKSIGYSYQF